MPPDTEDTVVMDDDDNIPAPDASELDLPELWADFTRYRVAPYLAPQDALRATQAAFLLHLRELVRDPGAISDIGFCDNCTEPEWRENLSRAREDVRICEACWDSWMECDRCEDRYAPEDTTSTLDHLDICDFCRGSYYSFCEECDGYYPDRDADEHDHSSSGDDCCESPQLAFTVRNDGYGPLPNDTRATVTLPTGVISAEGLKEVCEYLRRHPDRGARIVSFELDTLGDQWQTKAGNYTKRLSSHAYKTYEVKLPPEVLSQVGCIARAHSAQVSNYTIEVTRDLNQGPESFCNEESCWWGSYGTSRCALKTNGGYGLRSFDGDDEVAGRAWVLPLRQDKYTMGWKLTPTFDTLAPDALVVFNGYGELSGYAAPRVVAHMTGWTYRKVSFSCEPMYVNSGSGYLVGPEDIAAKYTDGSLSLHLSQHARLFYTEKETVNAA